MSDLCDESNKLVYVGCLEEGPSVFPASVTYDHYLVLDPVLK